MVRLLLLLSSFTSAKTVPTRPVDCYANAETAARAGKNTGMPLYLELIGIYGSADAAPATDGPGAPERAGVSPSVAARKVEVVLMRDGNTAFALINVHDGRSRRRGLGEQVRCAPDGHVEFRVKRLFGAKTPIGPPTAAVLSVWGTMHGRRLDATIEEKDAMGVAQRQELHLLRLTPAAVADLWSELVARRGFEACADAASAEAPGGASSPGTAGPGVTSAKPRPNP
jgi:hypothetical protein